MKTMVYNIINEKNNTVANQFNVINGTNYTFLSYRTQIATLHAASAFIEINSNAFEYSRTTTRHFLNWFENVLTKEKPTRHDVETWIRWRTIPASVNCYHTDIDVKLVNSFE